MKRKILTLPEAKVVLEPYYSILANCIKEGFQEYIKVMQASQEVGHIEYCSRTKANKIHDHIVGKAKVGFLNFPNVLVDEWNKIFGIKIQDDILIRFKKLNDDYEPSNIPTVQSKKFLQQAIIDGFPDEPTFLYAGYQLDKTYTEIIGIYLVCWDGKQLLWLEDINTNTSLEQISIPFFTEEKDATITKRVRVIPTKTDKTGTDD